MIGVKQFADNADHPNRASANAMAQFLAALQKGSLLQPAERDILFQLMTKSRTGVHRMRAGVPSGTVVLDKTGTGGNGSATNDVGIVTLPNNEGHLAIAVFISGSKAAVDAQESAIAEMVRAAYEQSVTR
jgi:beta-lactamase class A